MLVKDMLLIDKSKVDFYAVGGMSLLCAMPTTTILWAAYVCWYAMHVALLHTNSGIKADSWGTNQTVGLKMRT
jgi:hypothetical protein